MKSRGFTLVEVLVAVSILGLGLTIILSSQAGLFASSQRVEHVTAASNLLRCKMTEVELQLQKYGFPLLDQTEQGECCEEESDARYSCEWAIEPIELPQPSTMAENAMSDPTSADTATDTSGTGGLGTNMGALGALMTLQQTQGASLGENPTMTDFATMMSESSPDGSQGMVAMAMSFVYPSLKPMLEASIRKITVRVRWLEGSRRQELSAVQYLTNPTEGALDPNAASGLEDLANQLSGDGSSGTTTPSTGTGTGTGTRSGTSGNTPTRGGAR